MDKSVKLSLIICFLYVFPLAAQSQFQTNGLFAFQRVLNIPDTYEVGPGQLSKDGRNLLLGLIDGDLENLADLHSDIYAYKVTPDASALPITAMNLYNPVDSMRLFQVTASQNETHLVFVVNAYSGWNDNELGIADKNPDGTYSKIRMLTELNDPLVSDAYPWMSSDGLRLYYTRNFKLMFAERTNAQSTFSAPVEVDFTGDVQLEVVSIWLSNDEKTIFLVANNRIYRSVRKSTTESFPLPSLYSDEFSDFYFISGLSFAPDKRTMYLYYSDENAQKILHYKLKKGKAW